MRRLPAEMAAPIFLVAVVLMMVIPITPVALDLLLALNLTFAILILLGTLLLKDSLDFSVFPSLLLVATLARLALNPAGEDDEAGSGVADRHFSDYGGDHPGDGLVPVSSPGGRRRSLPDFPGHLQRPAREGLGTAGSGTRAGWNHVCAECAGLAGRKGRSMDTLHHARASSVVHGSARYFVQHRGFQ